MLLNFFQDKELKNNATAGIVLSDHSLVLQSLSRTSAGEYKCLAANSEGKIASNTVKLQVMCKFFIQTFIIIQKYFDKKKKEIKSFKLLLSSIN